MKKTGLIIVDLQNDFLPGGTLGVEGADAIIPIINELVKLPFDVCVATKDWHPPHHCSFASTWEKKAGGHMQIGALDQTLWPDHCIQGSNGAEFSKELDSSHFDLIVYKGLEAATDSYSTFFDNKRERSTGLEGYLREKNVQDLYFAGLTTEYCVLYSVLDALELGFTPHVVLDACRGVELVSGDVQAALDLMRSKGVEFVTSEQVKKRIAT